MGRIRTVKPDLFQHEELFKAEKETGLPLRVAFIGLFTCADKMGRFEWRPGRLKLNVLPWDECEFSRVLDALVTRGFIRKYASGDSVYGCIPTWGKHQVVNNREKDSELPDPEFCQEVTDACATREARVTVIAQGKGREGKGKGREWERRLTDADASAAREVWENYRSAYHARYGTEPVRNAKVNSQISQFIRRVQAEEAPAIAAYYVRHNGGYYVRRGHPIDALLNDAEKLRTEWVTNTRITETRARQSDRTEANGQVWAQMLAEAESNEAPS